MLATARYYLTWLLILGVYVANSIPKEGGLKAPAGIGGMAAIALLLLNMNKMRIKHLVWIIAIAAMALVSLTLRAYTWPEVSLHHHLTGHLASWVVFIYGIVIGYSAYLELTQWGRAELEKLLKILIWAILIGVALEVFVPPFKAFSDTVRHTIFAANLYEGDVRDLYLYGAVRPKLFTSEPSHLAKYFALFTVGWLLITRHRHKYIWFFGFVVVGMFLIRSPIVLIAPIIAFANLFITTEMSNQRKILLLFGVLAVLLPLVLLSAETILVPRLERISAGKDTSFIVRFLAPYVVMAEVIRDHPVLGLGFGAKEIGLDYTREAALGLSSAAHDVQIRGIGHNFLFTSVIQFGLAGFPVFIFLLWRMIVIFGRDEFFMITMTMVGFMQAMGNPNSFRIWFFMFMLCAIVCARQRGADQLDLAPARGGQAFPMSNLPGGGRNPVSSL